MIYLTMIPLTLSAHAPVCIGRLIGSRRDEVLLLTELPQQLVGQPGLAPLAPKRVGQLCIQVT
jgi:hypothetical protein